VASAHQTVIDYTKTDRSRVLDADVGEKTKTEPHAQPEGRMLGRSPGPS
jgi:hypothetical protein